jgi:hypothetical protein
VGVCVCLLIGHPRSLDPLRASSSVIPSYHTYDYSNTGSVSTSLLYLPTRRNTKIRPTIPSTIKRAIPHFTHVHNLVSCTHHTIIYLAL